MLNQNNNKIYIIIFFFIIIINFKNLNNILEPICLNQNNVDLELIIKIVEKFLDTNNVPVLNKNEKLIAEYWNEKNLCPFSELISHGLTKKEAFLIIDFFQIEDINDLNRLKEWLIKVKK